MTELTCKQFKVYEFVKGHIKDKQYPPTYKEIAKEFSITVKSAHDYIKAIERKGYVKIIPIIARGMVVIK